MSLLSDILKTIFGSSDNSSSAPEKPQTAKPVLRKRNSKKITKTIQVRNHLIEKGSIDSWTAIELYGATRLSAIIFNLRNEGLIIDSIPNTAYDRNQNICNYTTYKLVYQNGVN
jgi:hypothetical protein